MTTGGNGHLDCGVVISPKGGKAGADLGVNAVELWQERALSARSLNDRLPPGELPPLFRRTMRTCSGEMDIGMGCDTCGKLWLCVCAWEYLCATAGPLDTEPGDVLDLLS